MALAITSIYLPSKARFNRFRSLALSCLEFRIEFSKLEILINKINQK